MRPLRPLEPTWWRLLRGGPDRGDYEQQDGQGRLRRVLDVRGRTTGWVVYVHGVERGQAKTLGQAKRVAYEVTKSEERPCN
jgi:hypothetical protein